MDSFFRNSNRRSQCGTRLDSLAHYNKFHTRVLFLPLQAVSTCFNTHLPKYSIVPRMLYTLIINAFALDTRYCTLQTFVLSCSSHMLLHSVSFQKDMSATGLPGVEEPVTCQEDGKELHQTSHENCFALDRSCGLHQGKQIFWQITRFRQLGAP